MAPCKTKLPKTHYRVLLLCRNICNCDNNHDFNTNKILVTVILDFCSPLVEQYFLLRF